MKLFGRRQSVRAQRMAELEATNQNLRQLIAIHHKIQRVRRLADGWHGTGSVAIDHVALLHYVDFLHLVEYERIADAELAPTADGMVRMEWDRDGFSYVAEIGADKLFLCSLAPDSVDTEAEVPFSMDVLVKFFNDGTIA